MSDAPRNARSEHETRPVQIWADIDVGVAELVERLNTVEGVRTFASCQGTLDEGGPAPYGPYVTVSWSDEAVLQTLRKDYNVVILGEHFGNVEPRPAPSTARSAS